MYIQYDLFYVIIVDGKKYLKITFCCILVKRYNYEKERWILFFLWGQGPWWNIWKTREKILFLTFEVVICGSLSWCFTCEFSIKVRHISSGRNYWKEWRRDTFMINIIKINIFKVIMSFDFFCIAWSCTQTKTWNFNEKLSCFRYCKEITIIPIVTNNSILLLQIENIN